MKKIIYFIICAFTLASCHITTKEEPVQEDQKTYEAYGLLTITSSGFTKDSLRVKMVEKDDATMDLYMFEVKFAALMPVTIDMLISGVGYAVSGDEIHFYGDSIVPTAAGKPYEKYTIRNLEGRITADSIILSNYYGTTPSIYRGKLSNKK
ncbi:MAG: hypothetical protein IJ548_04315 [Paludibacteraceae bacterium]|nr:hypothetical protein [Paludibacteraceae bacterium]MBQ9297147.1 hypothetical protein [Paludibacteraceae bacterium]MBR1556491.1 hypothetical protein [Prevotella sp.]